MPGRIAQSVARLTQEPEVRGSITEKVWNKKSDENAEF